MQLKPDEDPVPTERRMVEVDVKGKNKDLTITRGEYVDVISKHNCPKGKVLVQNSSGKRKNHRSFIKLYLIIMYIKSL